MDEIASKIKKESGKPLNKEEDKVLDESDEEEK